jgi:cysteinyl-tRNA synthetase
MLQIYNTKTQKKEPFTPIIPGKISLYACGVTVYDYCHIGHARTYIAFDVIVRYLRFRNYQVQYVRNITDIDDKIINKANQGNGSITEVTTKFINALNADMWALKLLTPDHEPRATEFIPQMIALVERLEKNAFAYLADNGDVYYNVRKYKNYGSLSKRNIDELQLGARVDINTAKQDPLDFVLWKKAKPGEPSWPSPWGEGRPGWHLECSAMSMYYLGDTLDIHGGGFDLIFPHHENECAQSEAATGKPFVNTWMHVGFLKINKEKMSKSLNNFFTIREVLQEVHPEVLKYALTNAHYRSHIEYSEEQLVLSKNALEKFYLALRGLPIAERPVNSIFEQRFITAMDDDFNTHEALAVLFDLTKEINKLREQSILTQASSLAALLKHLGGILGLLNSDPEQFLQNLSTNANITPSQIEEMLSLRNKARKDQNWLEADQIRKNLETMGIVIEDGATDTTWRKK